MRALHTGRRAKRSCMSGCISRVLFFLMPFRLRHSFVCDSVLSWDVHVRVWLFTCGFVYVRNILLTSSFPFLFLFFVSLVLGRVLHVSAFFTFCPGFEPIRVPLLVPFDKMGSPVPAKHPASCLQQFRLLVLFERNDVKFRGCWVCTFRYNC